MSQYATDGTPSLPLVTLVVTFCPVIAHESRPQQGEVGLGWF